MVEITWLGHGTSKFRLESGEVLVLDPWTDGNPAYPKDHKFDRVDYILITHGHFDHIHDVIPLAKQFEPQIIAIFETTKWLESKGVKNLNGMNKGGSQMAGPVKVTMTHAVHSCGIIDGDQIVYGGEASGYVLQLPDAEPSTTPAIRMSSRIWLSFRNCTIRIWRFSPSATCSPCLRTKRR
jgi:L-ascorbate metabolism protein UlaG (beta-lactamase superfamily)